MADRPRLLDLFCGAGGAGMGYHRAGFDVVGVDIAPQPRYPFTLYVDDAIAFVERHGRNFDAIHASPPCQAYTWGTRRGRDDRWPKLIGRVRELVGDRPYVIENVQGAGPDMIAPAMLCGSMFGLEVNRHRLFESSAMLWPLPAHPSCTGRIARGEAVTVAGHGGNSLDFRLARWQQAMGIDWTRDRHELAEAIPPAYTEWVGEQLLISLRNIPVP